MNPKQIACVILLMIIGAMTYTAQVIHKTVATTRAEAEDAETAAVTAESERSTAEIETTGNPCSRAAIIAALIPSCVFSEITEDLLPLPAGVRSSEAHCTNSFGMGSAP